MNRTRLWITLFLTLAIAWGGLAVALGSGLSPKLGLDLQGGFSVLLVGPDDTDPEVLDKAVEIMRRRIEELGDVQEPEISVVGDRAIQVQLPGVQDRERALAAVGTTGILSFRPVLEANIISPAFTDGTLPLPTEPAAEGEDGATTTTTTTQPPSPPPENLDPETGLTIVDSPDLEVAYLQGDDGFVYKVGTAFLTGSDIEGAEAGFTQGFSASGWVVDPSFTSEGGVLFEEATAELSLFPVGDPRRQMAIVVDGVVASAPQIAEDVPAGEGLDPDQVFITVGAGEDPQSEAEDLATILKYGALPTTFERERVESVSASLGSDSLRAGLIAGVGGLILVALYLLAYYRALGLIAVVGLTVFGSLLLLAMTLLSEFQGVTLTLAGVTGVVVSIGITADSYIVFFERIKEEHRRGRPLRASVDYGFKRAFHTIVTADTVTFTGSALLWVLAIGSVKAFALTLGLATIIDVIVAYYFTRPAAFLMSRSRLATGGPLSIQAAMGRASAGSAADEREAHPPAEVMS